MKFRTEIPIPETTFKIGYQQKNMFIGSCFTENIGKRVRSMRISTSLNPFGIVYNPISVKNSLEFLIQEKQFAEKDLFQLNDHWNNFYFHSNFSAPNLAEGLSQMNKSIKNGAGFLKQTDFLFITFGTAFCFEHSASGITVSNNHKIPAQQFRRYRLSVENIVSEYSILLKKLRSLNPELQIIFTVSPVRHLKDGAHGNQLSKSILLLAVDQLISEFDFCSYFPAYEIFMDDLRDYRFYSDDLVHPSDSAVSYVWEKFQDTYFDKNAIELGKEIEKINKAMWHKVNNPESDSHKKFLQRYADQVLELQEQYPFLNLEDALSYFYVNNPKKNNNEN